QVGVRSVRSWYNRLVFRLHRARIGAARIGFPPLLAFGPVRASRNQVEGKRWSAEHFYMIAGAPVPRSSSNGFSRIRASRAGSVRSGSVGTFVGIEWLRRAESC